MKRFSFTSIRFDRDKAEQDIMTDSRLEDMSRDGWEIKTVYTFNDHWVTIYLQREL